MALAVPTLAQAESYLVGSGPLTTVLAPGTTVEKSLRLELRGTVGSLGVWVRIMKAHVGDLTLTLVAPDGRTRVLTERRGSAEAGLGDGTPGCKGSAIVFTDDGYTTLDRATPPFTGWVKAAQRLAGLNGVPAAGRWTLRIANATGGVPGTLTCWRLAVGLDVDTTVTARSGHTTASVTYRELDYQYDRVRLRIAGPGASLAVPLARINCSDCPSAGPSLLGGGSPLTVRGLDGDGEPEVILDTYTGGAHCCSVSLIFRRAGARYVRSVAFWGNPGYRLADLGRDGRAELVTSDDTFGYLFTSWASSGEPLLVFGYSRGKLTDVTRRFPEQIRADADRYWHAAQEQLRARGGEPRGLLAAWAADMANLDRWDEAQATLAKLAALGKLGDNEQLDTAAGAASVKGLIAHLEHEGYLAAGA